MKVEIDGKLYVPQEASTNARAMQLSSEIYGVLWCEAFYDPTNETLKAFAEPLARKMTEANKTLHFKT